MSVGYKSIGRLLPIVLFRSTTGTAVEYDVIYGNLSSTTETVAQMTLDYDVICRRFRVTLTANPKTGTSTISFRDDAADVTGTLLTIPATPSLAEVDSGAISTVIRAGSKINFKWDLTGSGAGTISAVGLVMLEVVT